MHQIITVFSLPRIPLNVHWSGQPPQSIQHTVNTPHSYTTLLLNAPYSTTVGSSHPLREKHTNNKVPTCLSLVFVYSPSGLLFPFLWCLAMDVQSAGKMFLKRFLGIGLPFRHGIYGYNKINRSIYLYRLHIAIPLVFPYTNMYYVC